MRRALLLAPLLLAARPAAARGLEVLSAGAMEGGLQRVAAAFRAATGTEVALRFNSAPQLRERFAAGALSDLVIAPVDQIAGLQAAGRLGAAPVPLGRVAIGAATRIGAPALPADDLQAAVAAADRVIYNRASTGLYLERLFDRMGLGEAVAAKAVRYARGADVMRHIERGEGSELGLAPITEILLVPAVRYLGPLAEAVQNRTAYAAAVRTDAPPEAAALLAWLARPESRAAFVEAGVEPP